MQVERQEPPLHCRGSGAPAEYADSGDLVAKDRRNSTRKIDAAVAAILAFERTAEADASALAGAANEDEDGAEPAAGSEG